MNWKLGFTIVGFGCCFGLTALAADVSGKRYIDMMVNGGPPSVRNAAEEIYNTHTTDEEVLDVAAQTLLEGYQQNTSSDTQNDAMAWVCRALGGSGDGRYKSVGDQVAKGSGNRKLQKHCTKAASELPTTAAAGYQAGSVNLAKYKAGSSGAAPAQAKAAPAPVASTGRGSFADVKAGMSMEEVSSLIGEPTATTAHQTGKAWIPFNFKGKDTVRLIGLYKGVGRIVYSKENAYTSTFRVLEVVPDSKETGYP